MNERPHVLLLVDQLTEGLAGAERTVLWLAVSLPARGFDVTVVTTRYGSGWPLGALAEAGVRHLGLERRSRLDGRAIRTLARLIRRERVDVLHAHMFGSNFWGALLGRALGVPAVIAHEHSWPFEGDQLRRGLDCVIGRLSDAFVAVSQADAGLMRSYEHVPADRIRVIPTAWVPAASPSGADIRAEVGIPADAPVIGTVAHMRPVKRLDLLIQSFARVLEEVPDAWLLLGGDGDARPQLEEEARRLGVADRTRISGLLRDPAPLWEAIDVAAMTSDREGLPTAALEAMAAGVPMVAAAVGGLPEVLGGGCGVLFPRRDVDALTSELVALLRDPQRRAEIGARGRARAADYTLERQIDRCVELYRELLARPPRKHVMRHRALA